MHLSDGVLNLPIVVGTSIMTAGSLGYSLKGIQESEIPKISLITATFFVASLISIPIGPTSIHPLLAGLIGIMLGKRSPIAIFIALLLQGVLFQHGGITTLGANTLLVYLPAIFSHLAFKRLSKKNKHITLIAGLIAGMAILICVLLLIVLLYLSDGRYSEGFFSVVNLLVISYLPLVIIESLLTAFAVGFIYKTKPAILEQ
ncbi:cobalt/nickel transport system permease protein [Natranaerovirga hydrolytica]|uniref:Cobalt/nickel transport system permease protein n=2 Tax=Natranaerovirga hydrolytica TaxID=680378 RepID=A0A4R1N583_9FIRM|nr:cobalt/nickel transport system permease protein [Natranaerovirga hydrolytica]